MTWLFDRGVEELCVKARYADDTAQYLLVICWPDGEQCERFTNVTQFRSRLIQVERRLAADGWTPRRRSAAVRNLSDCS